MVLIKSGILIGVGWFMGTTGTDGHCLTSVLDKTKYRSFTPNCKFTFLGGLNIDVCFTFINNLSRGSK